MHKTKTRHFTTFTVYIFSLNIPRKLGRLKALEILPVLLLFKPRSTAWSLSSVSLFCVCFHCCYCCVFFAFGCLFFCSFFFKLQFLRKMHFPNFFVLYSQKKNLNNKQTNTCRSFAISVQHGVSHFFKKLSKCADFFFYIIFRSPYSLSYFSNSVIIHKKHKGN